MSSIVYCVITLKEQA